jgi:N-acetylneuraminic acid mutarotase
MNPRPRRFVILLPCTIAVIAVLSAMKPAPARTLSFAERVAYQRAIEEVYWHHRIWPNDRPDSKPPLDQVMTQAQIEKKVADYLRNSQALEDYWQRPLTAEQLQAEMERMAQHTKQPEVLRELFVALGNDPFIIAECLARPALSERLVTNWYAYDQRFHGELKQRAEADLQAHPTVEGMKQTLPAAASRSDAGVASGTYSEIEFLRGDSGEDDGRAAPGMKLNSREWDENVQKLAAMFGDVEHDSARPQATHDGATASITQIKTGILSPLQEDTGLYYATAVVGKANDRLKLATVAWFKEPLESWRNRAENQVPMSIEAPTANYTLPIIPDGPNACTDDTWRAVPAPPENRQGHTEVWTGSEMIVWGGEDYPNSVFNSGGRYNPSTDSWIATSTTNAPTARYSHTAVWTGTEMIVWGAADANTGGRYNPGTDSWVATSTTNAPTARSYLTAVWTGSEMVVWGGIDSSGVVNTGGRYNPNTDTWTATSTANAPIRSGHTAVWTGSEMVIWGGADQFNYLNTGGRYNPGTNSWTATSTTNATDARYKHTAVWTDSEMIVWGGDAGGSPFNTGGRYNPSTNSWTATSTTNTPSGRYLHTAVWTGSEMIVWGGWDGSSYLNTGGRYNPSTNSWTATSTINTPSGRYVHTAVWSGSEMIVWGGVGALSYEKNDGGRYNPSTDNWTAVGSTPTSRRSHAAVWTGSEMIVWGGYFFDTTAHYLNTGGRYNPGTDSWTATSTTNAPSGRYLHTAVWSGSEMIVWGGYDGSSDVKTGGRYNPNTNSWTATSTTNAPTRRESHKAVWAGSEMIVWGGFNTATGYLNTGGKYNSGANSWTATSTTNAPSARSGHRVVWTDSEMIVWGGFNGISYFNNGARYNPGTNTWAATSTTNAPIARSIHTAVWSGNEMIVWGGYDGFNYLGTGGRYNPSTDSWTATSSSNAPPGRLRHTGVWTGSEMIVWGGILSFNIDTNTGGRYCAQSGSPTPTPTPTPTATPTPTPTPTPAPARVTVAAVPTQINEGQTATYKVRASSAVAQDITVPYTMSGTATSGSDYTLNPSGGQVTILAGQSTAQVKLKAKTDQLAESTETAVMALQPGTGYKLGNPKEATVSILNGP